ncbi:MAG: hypothetical protein KAW39_00130 [Thermoplasmata archaeon]|nr:hypothetical protein [Thermoplasmata archaeon]
MPYFDDIFRRSLEELDRRKVEDSSIAQALERYEGRSVHLVVREDARYLFSVSSGKISFDIDPDNAPDDIYIEMDLPRAKRLIEERSFSVFDLLFVKYKNVTSEDISFVRTLFGS